MEGIVYIDYLLLSLLSGWLLDKLFGDPARLPHPIVGFGKLIAWGEKRWNHGAHRLRNGAVLSIGLVISVYAISSILLYMLYRYSVVASVVVSAILVFFCLAGTTLYREVRAVFQAADKSLADGRTQVGRIVGRDTSSLSLQEIRTAALETLAENLSDGVIAPLFWFLLLGTPGMLVYKMVNTLDSMIGYRNDRYLLFGRIAARMDDGFNYMPARITAWLLLVASGKWQLLPFVKRYGPMHLSPNSGYPEAAMAGILDCRFGGPHDYFGELVDKPYIGSNPRQVISADMQRALRVSKRAEGIAVLLIIVIEILIWLFVYEQLLMLLR